jgi:acyl carrier protein
VNTLEHLRELLARDFDLAAESLQPQARLEDLQIDSLRMLEILFGIEDAFKITVGTNQAELKARLQTVGDLVAYIDALMAEQAGAAAGVAAP